MSFIYEDKNLLEQLLKIGQASESPPINTNQLSFKALELIDKLKASTSSISATSEPLFTDLVDLNSFKQWLIKGQVTFRGKPAIVDNKLDKDAVSAILSDLRDKAAGKDEGYAEAMNNVIEQARKDYGIKVKPYVSTNVPATVGDIGKATPAPASVGAFPLLNLKINNKDVVVGDAKTDNAAGLNVQQINTMKLNLGFLNGVTVNFDEIVQKSRIFLGSIQDLAGLGGLHTQLFQVQSDINRTSILFDEATSKSPMVSAIAASPSDMDTEVERSLKVKFEAASRGTYTGTELSIIAKCYHNLMIHINLFFAILSLNKPLQTMKEDFEAQKSMALKYAGLFKRVELNIIDDMKRLTRN